MYSLLPFFDFCRPAGNKTNGKVSSHRRSSTPSRGVDAEVELEFTEKKPNQLAPLQVDVADGKLKNINVLRVVNAGRQPTY